MLGEDLGEWLLYYGGGEAVNASCIMEVVRGERGDCQQYHGVGEGVNECQLYHGGGEGFWIIDEGINNIQKYKNKEKHFILVHERILPKLK